MLGASPRIMPFSLAFVHVFRRELRPNAFSIFQVLSVSAALMCNLSVAQTSSSSSVFPPYLRDGFDYATFTRFDTGTPPKSLIYQSNGFLALQEQGFGGQKMIIPATVEPVPTNSSDRLSALEIDAPLFTDSFGRTYRFSDSPAMRSMTYFADRTVYRAAFDDGPEVSLTVYPVYGKPAAVFSIRIIEAHGPIRITLQTKSDGFRTMSSADREVAAFGSPRWPYRSLLATKPKADFQAGGFGWKVDEGGEAALIIALGGTEGEAETTLSELRRSSDLFDKTTHRLWNEYLASTPLVAPAVPIRFTIGTSGKQESIAPEELGRSELWFW